MPNKIPEKKQISKFIKFLRLAAVLLIFFVLINILSDLAGWSPEKRTAAFLVAWVAFLAALFVTALILGIVFFRKKGYAVKMRKMSDITTPFNAGRQFEEHLNALDQIIREFNFQKTNTHPSITNLTAAHTVSRQPILTLAGGNIQGRKFEIKSVLIGHDYLTRIETQGHFKLRLEACPCDEDLAVLGVSLPSLLNTKPLIKNSSLTVRLTGQSVDSDFIKENDVCWKKLSELLNFKPSVLNLSQQAVEFYSKKISITANKACLDDFGLVRDKEYFSRLLNLFAEFVTAWEAL